MGVHHLTMVYRVLIGILWLAGLLVAQSSEDEKTDEDDLLDMLDDTDNTELPREKYEELGLGDGLFNGKKIKRIVKVQSSDSKTKEGYKEEEGEAGEGMEKVHDIEDVESFHKIKSMKKIKKMTPIDADIADRMRKEVQEGTSESETTKSKNNKEEYNESSSSKQKIDDPDLTDKVTRILKMFNISDLDDIRKAVKISSMRKIKSKTKVTPMGDGIGDSSKFGFDISKYLRDGDDDSDSGEDIKMKIINEPTESSTEIGIDEDTRGIDTAQISLVNLALKSIFHNIMSKEAMQIRLRRKMKPLRD